MAEIFVVDNSVVMSWCFKDEVDEYADRVLDRLAAGAAVVPSIWPLEVVNVLLVAERKNRLKAYDSICFLTLLEQLPITVEYGQPERRMKELLVLARTNRNSVRSKLDSISFRICKKTNSPSPYPLSDGPLGC